MPKSSRGDVSNGFSLGKSLWSKCLLRWSAWWHCSNPSSLQILQDTGLLTSITEAGMQKPTTTGCHSWESPVVTKHSILHMRVLKLRGPKDSTKVTELISGKAGSREQTSLSLGLQLPSHSRSTYYGPAPWPARSISDGKRERQRGTNRQCSEHCSLPCPPIIK